MKIKVIRLKRLQAYCELWERGSGNEIRGLYLAYESGMYIAVVGSNKVNSDPYWQEEFASFIGAVEWLEKCLN